MVRVLYLKKKGLRVMMMRRRRRKGYRRKRPQRSAPRGSEEGEGKGKVL